MVFDNVNAKIEHVSLNIAIFSIIQVRMDRELIRICLWRTATWRGGRIYDVEGKRGGG